MNPKVSVIIPAYNVADYVEQCIDSVLKQSFCDLELLVVDDRSTDDTPKVIGQFADTRIRLLQSEVNRGQSHARNWAMQEARGEWLALLDADDWWAEQRLEKLLAVAGQEQADIVADDLLVVEDKTGLPMESALTSRRIRLPGVVRVSPIEFVDRDLGITQPVIRTAFWRESGVRYDESMRSGQEDFPFLLQLLRHSARFFLVPEAYYYYRLRSGSATSQRLKLFQATREATVSLLQSPEIEADRELTAALQRRKARIERILDYNEVRMAAQRGQLALALRTLFENPSVAPFAVGRAAKALQRVVARS